MSVTAVRYKSNVYLHGIISLYELFVSNEHSKMCNQVFLYRKHLLKLLVVTKKMEKHINATEEYIMVHPS